MKKINRAKQVRLMKSMGNWGSDGRERGKAKKGEIGQGPCLDVYKPRGRYGLYGSKLGI